GRAVDSSGLLPAHGKKTKQAGCCSWPVVTLCSSGSLCSFVTPGRQAPRPTSCPSCRRGVVIAAEGGPRRRRRDQRLSPPTSEEHHPAPDSVGRFAASQAAIPPASSSTCA